MNEQPANNEKVSKLIDHYFRHEHGKLVTILTRTFGAHNLELAEDVVQDTLLKALQTWSYTGIPDNPTGWLYTVARNQILNILKREIYKNNYAKELAVDKPAVTEEKLDDLFSEDSINDDQLKMMFICCHSDISPEAQVCLILKTLCGFSIDEISRAFLTGKETITKRLMRARKTMREANVSLDLPSEKYLPTRLEAVLRTLYLLFNEGYNASNGEDLIRIDLCEEAIRLGNILLQTKVGNTPKTHSLISLMYFNFSRFQARLSSRGEIIILSEQNRSLWDKKVIDKGFYHLNKGMENDSSVNSYFLQASVAACHCAAESYEQTDWHKILQLYDYLSQIDSSPIVLLNRIVALSNVHGLERALKELGQIKDQHGLNSYYLYFSVLADLHMRTGNYTEALDSLEKAKNLTKINSEILLLEKRAELCRSKIL